MAKSFKPVNFGRYLLTDRLATGGMAEIFTAKVFGAMGFEKQLVIKRILPQYAEDAEFLQMFITEAKLVCHLEHPNIVQVHELGEINGQYYIAMEYVNGIDARMLWRTLAKRKQRLPGVLALFIVAEFLKGLDYAHRAVGPDGELLGVVHRDVSPSNILISYRGDVKISDFGIALVHQESKTQAGVLKGKFGYMTPEQVAGMKVDHRSDIFAAGIVLAELLLGRRLFLGQSYFETLDKVLNVKLDVLDEHEAALPPDVIKIVRQALQREVDTRYQSAKEFGDAIVEFLYDRRARITNETLATFIAEHVVPYLIKGKEEGSGKSSSAISPPPSSQSPVVSQQLVGGIKLPRTTTREPKDEPTARNPLENVLDLEAIEEFGSGSFELVTADSGTESVPRHLIEESISEDDYIEEHDMQTDQGIDIAQFMLTEPGVTAEQSAAEAEFSISEQSTPAEKKLEVHVPPAEDMQFGAIPVYEADDRARGKSTPEPLPSDLDSDAIDVAASASAASDDESKARLDLAGWDEEDFNIAPIISQAEEPAFLNVEQRFGEQGDRRDATYLGNLSSETATKTLFQYSIKKEGGLLILAGPESAGKQAEIITWLRNLQASAGAETDSNKADGRVCSIHLMNGQPHLVSADRNEEAIVAFLIRTGILTEEKVENAIKAHPQRKPVAALLAAGKLAPLQVLRHLTAFVLDMVLETFSWTAGDIVFYRGKENPSEAFPTGLDAISLITRGINTISEEALDIYFRQLEGHRIFLNRSPPLPIEKFKPDTILREAYRELSTARPVDELLQCLGQYGSSLAAKQALYLFIECELALLTIG